MTTSPCMTCGREPMASIDERGCTLECVNIACPERPSASGDKMGPVIEQWNAGAWYCGNKGGE